MDITKEIKRIMFEENVTLVELSGRLGTTFQNLGAKFKRNNFKISDLEKISDALGYDLKIEFIKKES